MKRKLCSVVLFVSLVFSGCSSNKNNLKKNTAKDYPVKIENVTINDKPDKVVVLSDLLADVVVELGYESQVVGRSSSCDQENLKDTTDVGDCQNLDIKKIEELVPKVLICDENLSDDQKKTLNDMAISVVKIEKAQNRGDLERVYTSVGSIFNGWETGYSHGQKSAKDILMTLDDIVRIIPKRTVPLTGCYIFDENGKVLPSNSFSSQLMESVGVINVAKDVTDGKISFESLKLSNPDWIFCESGLKEKLINNENFSSLEAVKNNQVVEVPSYLMLRQGQSIVVAVTTIAGAVYPELLEDSPSSEISSDVDDSTKATETSSAEETSQNESSNFTIESGMKISYGETSDKVLKVQERLDELNYLHVAPNSTFDDVMLQAVKDFQFLNGMSATGDVDEDLLKKLFSNDAVSRSDPARQK